MLNFNINYSQNGIETRTISYKDDKVIYELTKDDSSYPTDTSPIKIRLQEMLGTKLNENLIQILTNQITSPNLNIVDLHKTFQLIDYYLTSDKHKEIKVPTKLQMYLGEDVDTGSDVVLDFVNNSTTLIQGKSGSGKTSLLVRILSNYFNDRQKEDFSLNIACSEQSTLIDNLRFHYQVNNTTYFEDFNDMNYFFKFIERFLENRKQRLEYLGYDTYTQYRQGELLLGRPITLTHQLIVLDDVETYYDNLNFRNHTIKKQELDRLLLLLQRFGRDLGLHVIVTGQNFERTNVPKIFIQRNKQFICLDSKNIPLTNITNNEKELELGSGWYFHKDSPENSSKFTFK